jgi:hypothetical protein
MANVLVYQHQDSFSLTQLQGIKGIQMIDCLSAIGKKLWLQNEAWPRDQIVWLEGVAHETLNRRGRQQYVISSLLEARGVEVRTDRYLPFQGGHILQTPEHVFCASSCAIDQESHQHAFDRGVRLPWSLESLASFRGGESERFIRGHLPNAIVLPSLTGLPWSYHADLSVAFLGKRALISDPSLFASAVYHSDIEVGLQEVERILCGAGYEPLRFPLFYEPTACIFHAPLNGICLNGCFYYSLIEGMTEFNDFVKDFFAKNIPTRAEAILLPPGFLGRGGGLRCLSLEW